MDGSFPNAQKAIDPVTIITVDDDILNKSISFGIKPLKKQIKNNIFNYCKNENEIFLNFFKYLKENPFDVFSGYNIIRFDLQYIINRSKILFGNRKNLYKFLSPINIVKTWKQKNSNDINIDIAGISILDYYDIYKWYGPNLEKYTLDYVCKHELGVGKLDYSKYGDLKTLYDKNWQLYVEYNIIDCNRVNDLEKKLGYIKLIQSLSLFTKTPSKNYNVMTQLIEGTLLTHYRRKNMCAPILEGGSQEGFVAGYVKEPQVGMHQWVVSVDINSSYPSHIITLNMSPETYIGRITGLKESQIVYYTKNKEFNSFNMFKEKTGHSNINGNKLKNFNMALKRGIIDIAPCGSVFSTSKIGVIPEVERITFFKRKKIKQEMLKLKSNMITKEEKIKVDQLYNTQWALKIWLNAVFGVTAVPFSRYFNINIAEAITSCGRHTIKQGERFVNELLNNPNDELKKIIEDLK